MRASSSFKPPEQILVYPPQLIPQQITMENYRYVLEETRYLTFVKNSLIVVAFTITGHVLSVNGGHGFRMLEHTVLFEIKQGPYGGPEEKVRFATDDEGRPR